MKQEASDNKKFTVDVAIDCKPNSLDTISINMNCFLTDFIFLEHALHKYLSENIQELEGGVRLLMMKRLREKLLSQIQVHQPSWKENFSEINEYELWEKWYDSLISK